MVKLKIGKFRYISYQDIYRQEIKEFMLYQKLIGFIYILLNYVKDLLENNNISEKGAVSLSKSNWPFMTNVNLCGYLTRLQQNTR